MTIARTAILGLTALSLAASGLAACSTLSGRDRIERRPRSCADQTVQIYFEPLSADLTKEARAVLAAGETERAACKVTGVEVLGLSDAVGGDSAANLELSKKRAQSVSAALAALGLPTAQFKVGAAGGADAMTPRGQDRPLRRRVDITVHLARP